MKRRWGQHPFGCIAVAWVLGTGVPARAQEIDANSLLERANTLSIGATIIEDPKDVGLNQTALHDDNVLRLLLSVVDNHASSSQMISGAVQSQSESGIEDNMVSVNILGYDNNSSLMFDFDGVPLFSGRLVPGQIIQSGKGNSITMNVGLTNPSSSNNLFAFSQKGESNQILGSANGNFNQAVVVQAGVGNFTKFSQIGSYNIIGISQ